MKLKHTFAICGIAAGLVSGRAQEIKLNLPQAGNQSAPANSAAPAAAPAEQFTDAQLAEELGWFYGKKMGLAELEFTKPEVDAMIKGLKAAADGKDSPYELEKVGPHVDAFMQKKQTAYVGKLKEKNTAANAAFFSKLAENKNVVTLPDGLRYEILQPGSGAYPKPTDTVKVNYTGTLIDGTVFDQSQPGHPAEFALNQVIPGWTEGIQKINKGGKIKLYVPPQLGYGDNGNGRIPPDSTLVFEVDLLDINPPAAANAPTAPAGEK